MNIYFPRNVYIRCSDVSLLNQILQGVQTMSNDLSVLQGTVEALKVKSVEVVATLAGLAQAIIDLKNSAPADVQAGIDALAVDAQAVLDGLSAAEDAADDQLPPAP